MARLEDNKNPTKKMLHRRGPAQQRQGNKIGVYVDARIML